MSLEKLPLGVCFQKPTRLSRGLGEAVDSDPFIRRESVYYNVQCISWLG